MHWFCKPSFAQRYFHLYLVEKGGEEWNKRLAFRDYLKTQPEIADEYVALKRAVAIKFEHDREAYSASKSDFIEKITETALNHK